MNKKHSIAEMMKAREMANKNYSVRVITTTGGGVIHTGTIDELVAKYFHTKLDLGHKVDATINNKPKTIDELIFNLAMADNRLRNGGLRTWYANVA